MIIIPAIDVIEGKCVRLSQGDFSRKTVYDEDPLEIALRFEDAGIKRLHLVDLEGARHGAVKNWKTLEKIAGKTSLVIDFSGGISTEENLAITFNSGAALATIGSVALKNPGEFQSWLKNYGAEKFILGADVKNEKISIDGWNTITVKTVFDHIAENIPFSVTQYLCTDISKDGLLAGASVQLYRDITEQFPSINLIASGGISCIDDIYEVEEAGCVAAIIGKALYEDRITLKDLKVFN